MRRRTLRWATIVVATALVAGSGARAVAADVGVPPAPAPAVLDPVDLVAAAGSGPTADGVAARLGRLPASLGSASIVVVDPSTGSVLFDRRPGRPRTPASTTKLATAAAALEVLGPDTRIATTVHRLADTVFLVGGGDPTLVRAGGGTRWPAAAHRFARPPGKRAATWAPARRFDWCTTTRPSGDRAWVPAGPQAGPRPGWPPP